jgi:Carboxypeptidase regulatory-like domain
LNRALLMLLALEFALCGIVRAQVPNGSIAGVVTDPSGAAIPGASVIVTNKETGLRRALAVSEAGEFSAPALLPGVYEVTADAKGFKHLAREAIVEAGITTSVNLAMEVGSASEQLTVQAALPQISYESHEISGVVTPSQIETVPLNGRDYLELAKLEPGAQQPTRASNNRTLVPLLGAPAGQNGRATRVTVDGGSVMEIGNGGAAMGLSQEVVQEFQVSTVDFDLSTAATASGAINVATRSGTNQLHGSAFIFFRDHHLSAYPGLSRDPSDPDPFFQRRQFGVALGGPIRKDRAFFFGTFERNEQRGVIATELVTPDFAPLSRISPSPTYVDQLTFRTDFQVSDKESLFVRYSHEDSFSFAPTTVNGVVTATSPSAWARQPAWADQSILGLTSQLGAHQMNDVRFSYFFVSAAQRAPQPSDCLECLGLGAPSITVRPDLFIGTSTTDTVLGRRYQLTDLFTWQKGAHGIQFGGDWETARGGRTDTADQPVTMTLFAPQTVRVFNAQQPPNLQIPLPATFLTVADVLQLPLQNFTVGIGDPRVPQAGFGNARVAPLVYLFVQDTWHLRPRFVLNYGLGWTYDAPLNYDLHKPAYLAPILGVSGLAPTHKNWKDFSPSLGFAWNLRNDGKTVIRGGVGVYYDAQTPFGIADPERVSLGPRGVGRGSYFSGGIRDPNTGTLLDFSNPSTFTGASLLQILPTIRANLTQLRGDPNNRNFSVTNIELDKQGSVDAADFLSVSATHFSFGVQREVVHDLVISADFVLREFRHIGPPPGLVDANHFSSADGPVLPLCTDAQRTDPAALCSLGPIFVNSGIGSARYEGLLVRADKRLSHNFQFLASYAYSSDVGNNFSNGFNDENPLGNKGPLGIDFRHILNLSGVILLPKRFQLGLVLTYVSKPPFSAFLGGLDLNGDGTTGDLLPGTTVNEFNRGLGKADLQRLVAQFNSGYAGKRDAKGAVIPPIVLPSQFAFGDSFLTQDLHLRRDFHITGRWQLSLIGEAFNVFNIANLSGRSGNLLAPGFGQPTSRVTQVFGSGGPRSFQLAARVSF